MRQALALHQHLAPSIISTSYKPCLPFHVPAPPLHHPRPALGCRIHPAKPSNPSCSTVAHATSQGTADTSEPATQLRPKGRPVQQVVVLGAGVIGLTSALRLLQAGLNVTVVASSMGHQTTTAGAAGLWGPFKLWDTPAALVERWSGHTLSHLYDLLHSSDAEEAGVSLRLVHAFQDPGTPTPCWSSVVDHWAPLTARQLARVNAHRRIGAPFTEGWSYHSIACEGGPYLAWLHRQIEALGGHILLTPQPVTALTQLCDPVFQHTWQPYTPSNPSPHPPTGQLEGLTLLQYLNMDSNTQQRQERPLVAGETASAVPAAVGSWQPPDHVDLVVNCSGLGAHRLLGDEAMTPIRGQVLRVRAPWVTSAYLQAADYYVIPNNEIIVLGGTAQVGNWNTEASTEDRQRIVAGCLDMLPSLGSAVILRDWVGLRPGRSSVRLELEASSPSHPAGMPPVIHNYGHGGSGLTLAWGCAGDVVELVKTLA